MSGVGKLDKIIQQNDQLIDLEKRLLLSLESIDKAIHAGIQALSEPESELESAVASDEEDVQETDVSEVLPKETEAMEIRSSSPSGEETKTGTKVRRVSVVSDAVPTERGCRNIGSGMVSQPESGVHKSTAFGTAYNNG